MNTQEEIKLAARATSARTTSEGQFTLDQYITTFNVAAMLLHQCKVHQMGLHSWDISFRL